MKLEELAAVLERDEAWVIARVEEGLPFRTLDGEREFSPPLVRDWLMERGYVQADPVVVGTVKAVAEHFGVTSRTVQNWKDAGMPWRAGYFDLTAIAAWREANKGDSTKQVELQERGAWETQLAQFKAQRAKLEYEELAGQLIKIDGPKRIVEQTIHAIRTHLEQFPDRLAGMLNYPVERTALLNTAKLAMTDLLRTVQHQLRESVDEDASDEQDEAA